MIFVDTSVWIDHFRGLQQAPHARALRSAVEAGQIVVGDLVLMEVLLGAPDEKRAVRLEQGMRMFALERMLDERLAILAARHYRTLRGLGATVRRSIDMLIGTFCIDRGYALLHHGRDFRPMQAHLGLRLVEPG